MEYDYFLINKASTTVTGDTICDLRVSYLICYKELMNHISNLAIVIYACLILEK